MVFLGYDRYGAHDGDWGAAVTMQLGPNRLHCFVIHLNMSCRSAGSQRRRSSV